MQQPLFALPESVRSSVLWCRPVLGTSKLFAIGFSRACKPEVISALSEVCEVKKSQIMVSGGIAYLVKVPELLLPSVRSLPQPRGGSRHESNYLPW